VNVADEMRKLYEREASQYDSKYDVNVPPKTRALYAQEIAQDLGEGAGRKALDVGTGTGFVAGILSENGYQVTGIDFSQNMVSVAKKNYPLATFAKLDIEKDDQAYKNGSFDLIITRQVVGHFVDPIAAFCRWHRWLASGGQVAVIDALWSREDWEGDWKKFVDYLPLACTQTWATVSYLLRQAQFAIKAERFLDQVNEDEAQRLVSAVKKPSVRYIVVAQK